MSQHGQHVTWSLVDVEFIALEQCDCWIAVRRAVIGWIRGWVCSSMGRMLTGL